MRAILLFLPVFAAVLAGSAHVHAAEPALYNRQRVEEFYRLEPDSLDWVFIGSSHAGCAFDPAHFDTLAVESFQMGMPLQLIDGSYFTLLEILEYQNPTTVVLDVYWYTLEKAYDLEQMDMFFSVSRNEALNKRFWNEAAPLNEKIKRLFKPVPFAQATEDETAAVPPNQTFPAAPPASDQTPPYSSNNGLTPTPASASEYYKGRGYVHYSHIMPPSQYGQIANQSLHDMTQWQPAPQQMRYLEKIAALCAEKNIRLVLTTAPVSNVYFGRIKNYGVFNDAVAAFAEEHALPYLDFNLRSAQEQIFADNCFFDAGHLNDRGAQRAAPYFIEWLYGVSFSPTGIGWPD